MAKQRRLPNTRQQTLGLDDEAVVERAEPAGEAVRFQDPDPHDIMVGGTRLDAYLEQASLGWVVRLRALLRTVDVSALEQNYQAGGKAPFHPRVMLGLIVYGITLGHNSLRQLEALARRDVGAWWLTGGLQPDHSTLGRFIVRHADAIQSGLFEDVTRAALQHVQLPTHDVAGDGTVIEAAASRFELLTREAAAAYAQRHPHDERAQDVARVAEQRTQARAAKGRKSSALVARTEPDAMMQKLKDGRRRPSYKPSIIANEHRFILAQTLHPSNETVVIPDLVAQAERTLEHPVPTLSLDAGYFCLTVIVFCLHNDIDLLCPSGRLDTTGNPDRARSNRRFTKADFRYDETRDAYVCPADRLLVRRSPQSNFGGRRTHVFAARTSDCAACPIRDDCTRSKRGRKIHRHDHEDAIDAMHQVMRQPAAQRRYRIRQASVEPVYSVMRYRGFTRFRRRGRAGATTEFALHCIAYNLERAVHIGRRTVALVAHLARRAAAPWRFLAVWLVSLPSAATA